MSHGLWKGAGAVALAVAAVVAVSPAAQAEDTYHEVRYQTDGGDTFALARYSEVNRNFCVNLSSGRSGAEAYGEIAWDGGSRGRFDATNNGSPVCTVFAAGVVPRGYVTLSVYWYSPGGIAYGPRSVLFYNDH